METRIKRNCQLYTAENLWDEIYNYETRRPTEMRIDENGELHWTFADGSHGFSLPNECAYKINMPLWELVMVDRDGDDEYALLFFE